MQLKQTNSGLFIVFEGIDNSGKSTQAKLTKGYLLDLGQRAVLSREPGGTKAGEGLREILKDNANQITPIGEVKLFCIARKAYKIQKVVPVISDWGVFISDRYRLSTDAYQGARGLDKAVIEDWNNWACEGLEPDLTILIDRDAREAINSKPEHERDRFEQDVEFMEKVRSNYLDFAAKDPLIKIVQYRDGDVNGMFEEVKTYLDQLLEAKK